MAPCRTHLGGRCLAEFAGTSILVLFGCGAVHSAVLTGAQSGLWQVAIVWGVGVMLAIYVVGAISGAHINPAITISLATWRLFPKRDVLPYVLSQMLGAFAAAGLLFVVYEPLLTRKEREKQVVRGQEGSELTAMCYGEFFPNPAPLAAGPAPFTPEAYAELRSTVTEASACCAEVLATAILALVVFALIDENNSVAPRGGLGAVAAGLCVAGLISVVGPLTQACLNPARDFGPRLFAYLAGWREHAFPPGLSFMTVYILSPIVGAVLGGGVYSAALRPFVAHANGPPEPE